MHGKRRRIDTPNMVRVWEPSCCCNPLVRNNSTPPSAVAPASPIEAGPRALAATEWEIPCTGSSRELIPQTWSVSGSPSGAQQQSEGSCCCTPLCPTAAPLPSCSCTSFCWLSHLEYRRPSGESRGIDGSGYFEDAPHTRALPDWYLDFGEAQNATKAGSQALAGALRRHCRRF